MIGLIQRVSEASVHVKGQTVGTIKQGILLLLGIEKHDNAASIEKLARKICNYRIFSDSEGKMNLSLLDIGGELLVVSQFTLVAQTEKGNRPGFSSGASPQDGKRMYEDFIGHVNNHYLQCQTGSYGEDMKVELTNDGPATFYFKV
jgi:D-tyrosyl-tRNA(Tyr) deacylase